ncbi:MAG: [Fe-Fe] hydrogenase large subunit C-terminal domain-containing protein [Thermoplasmatota archaeon]
MKVKVGIFGLTSCAGDQLTILNCEEDLLEIFESLDIKVFTMASSGSDFGMLDIAFVEGAVITEEDIEMLHRIRKNSRRVVAIGTCAASGGVATGKDIMGAAEAYKAVYGDQMINTTPLKKAYPLDYFVEVDYTIRGCPIREEEVMYYFRKFATMDPHKNEVLPLPIDRGIEEAYEEIKDPVINYIPEKCISCRRCVNVCSEGIGIDAISMVGREWDQRVSTPFGSSFAYTECISCGQCIQSCFCGALKEREANLEKVDDALSKGERVVVLVDPMMLASLSENLQTDEPENTYTLMKKVIVALKGLGVWKVFNYAAAQHVSIFRTVRDSLENPGQSKILTWCPAANIWITKHKPRFAPYLDIRNRPEHIARDLIERKYGPVLLVLVSPCSAMKKMSIFDAVISTKELSRLLQKNRMNVDLGDIESVTFDRYVMAKPHVDTLADTPALDGFGDEVIDYTMAFKTRQNVFHRFTLPDGAIIRTLDYPDARFKAATVTDLTRADSILSNISDYDFVEFIPCLEGCLSGGGQYPTTDPNAIKDRLRRMEAYNSGALHWSNRSLKAQLYRQLEGIGSDAGDKGEVDR